eukprot:TRINITY_DN78590_c0_g1_i1.p1 TRINITY_DN78590_c0_g1~~TRINITY_DN78590_c0_g1_i1.p1  ORF type:complete len:215 (+),score=51.82 TRINITY_DN78590_c0_g1_i1:197-841(+)
MAAELPDLDHIDFADYDKVYEPAEDSFLMMDTFLEMKNEIIASKPVISLEVGSGSGVLTTSLRQTLDIPLISFCTDVNEFAARTTLGTAKQNRITNVEAILTDLTGAFGKKLHGKVDILIFNPPYVPTPPEEVGHNDIRAAWAGGVDGMEVTNRFLELVYDLLSQKGSCYLVVVQDNKPEEIMEKMCAKGLKAERAKRKRAFNEDLSILRFWKE